AGRPYLQTTSGHQPQQLALRLGAGDLGCRRGESDVDLQAHSEVAGQVDAGLDREAGHRHQAAGVVGLQVVHVGALAVVRGADGVPGAVEEVLAVAGFLDHRARRVVDLEAADRLVRIAALHQLPGGVAGARDVGEDLVLAVGGRGSTDAAPGDVGVDARRLLLLGPQVDEQEVAGLDGFAVAGTGLVVRIGAVGVDADDRIALAPHPGLREGVDDPALHGVLVHHVAAAEDLADAVERFEDDAVQVDVGAAVAGELLLAPGGGEPLRQIGGGDQLGAGGAHQLGGAGVKARDGGELVVRAVL